MRAVRKRPGDGGEVGAGSVEYVGVTSLVVIIVLSVVVSATPIGQSIAARLCEAVGTTCGAPLDMAGDDPDAPPPDPCVLSTGSVNINAQVSISFVDLGGGRTLVTEQMSDGTYRVTLSGDVLVGASLTAGEADAHLNIGGYGAGLDVSASVGAGIAIEGGAEYTFGSEQEAADFQEWAYREFAQDTARGVVNSYAPHMGWTVDAGAWLIDRVTGYDYVPPPPTSVFLEGGVAAYGSASARQITGGAYGSFSAQNALGAERNVETGETTVYQQVTIDAEVAAEMGFATVADASGNVSMMLAVTMDENFEMSEVSFSGTATAEGSYNLAAYSGTELQGLQDSGGVGINLEAAYDVTDANRAETMAALAGLGAIQVLPGASAAAPAAALPWIISQAREGGTVTAQTLDVSSGNLVDAGLALKAPEVGGVGLGLSAGTSSTSSREAWYLGDHGWNGWDACSA